jgi:succinyl-CoA synthetase alpha subunit
MIGDIGGPTEEAAAYFKANATKPVVSYIAYFTAPTGYRTTLYLSISNWSDK